MGGMQVLQWAATIPTGWSPRFPSPRRAPFRTEHRVPRSRPAGHHGRSGLERRRLSAPSTRPTKGLAVARMAAHITYLSETALQRKFGTSSGSRTASSASSRLPDRRAISPSGHDIRRPLRCQFLSLHHPRDGLFRSRRRLWRRSGARPSRPQTRFCIISFTSDWLFPTLENKRIAHALNAAAQCASSRSKPTAATMPSCSTSRKCSRPCAAFSIRRAARAGASREERRDESLPRPDLAAIAEMIPPARACSTSVAATVRCSNISPTRKQVDGRGIELSQQNVNACVARGLSVDTGRRRHGPFGISRRRFSTS